MTAVSSSLFDITIDRYPVFMAIGCYPMEQICQQRVFVSLKVSIRLDHKDLEKDAIESVLNYELLVKQIDAILKNGSVNLLEKAVYLLGYGLMNVFDQLESCHVHLSKEVLPKSDCPLYKVSASANFSKHSF